MAAISEILAVAADDPAIKVIVRLGECRSFCAGFDVSSVTEVVRFHEGGVATSEDVRSWVRARLAACPVSKKVNFVTEELPEGHHWQGPRRVIRDMYWSGRNRQIG